MLTCEGVDNSLEWIAALLRTSYSMHDEFGRLAMDLAHNILEHMLLPVCIPCASKHMCYLFDGATRLQHFDQRSDEGSTTMRPQLTHQTVMEDHSAMKVGITVHHASTGRSCSSK
jgi:hypothetical protein